MQRVAIIDYGSGNLHSAAKAFERAARESGADAEIVVTADPDIVAAADRIVLPGVGAFADCKRGLEAVPGMREALETRVREQGAAVPRHLRRHAAHGDARPGVRGHRRASTGSRARCGPSSRAIRTLKIPHMGWNTLSVVQPAPAARRHRRPGREGLHAYFVHSFHLCRTTARAIVAETDYGGPVTAMVAKDNMAGTQFHPEKSQTLGLKLIANFLKWRP